MTICNDCGSVFDESDILDKDEFGRQYITCPYCGSEDWEEMHRCGCGEWIRDSQDLCECCKETVQESIEMATNHMVNRIKNMSWRKALALLGDYIEEEL